MLKLEDMQPGTIIGYNGVPMLIITQDMDEERYITMFLSGYHSYHFYGKEELLEHVNEYFKSEGYEARIMGTLYKNLEF